MLMAPRVLSNSIVAQANGVTPLFNLSNPFPQGLPTPWGDSAGLAIALGQTIEGPLRTESISYMNNWSFDIQRQLPWNLSSPRPMPAIPVFTCRLRSISTSFLPAIWLKETLC